MGVLIVARKAGRPKSDQPARVVAVALKSTSEWKEWLQRTADAERIGVPDLIDRAIAEYARNHGIPDPPKR